MPVSKFDKDSKYDRLLSLQVTLRHCYFDFNDHAFAAYASEKSWHIDEAEKAIAKMKDCIQRYEDNRLQTFEEVVHA